MRYSFVCYRAQSNGKIYWIAKSTVLKECEAKGRTSREAIAALELAEEIWLNDADKFGIPIPKDLIEDRD